MKTEKIIEVAKKCIELDHDEKYFIHANYLFDFYDALMRPIYYESWLSGQSLGISYDKIN